MQEVSKQAGANRGATGVQTAHLTAETDTSSRQTLQPCALQDSNPPRPPGSAAGDVQVNRDQSFASKA